jgi:hypothetical protein
MNIFVAASGCGVNCKYDCAFCGCECESHKEKLPLEITSNMRSIMKPSEPVSDQVENQVLGCAVVAGKFGMTIQQRRGTCERIMSYSPRNNKKLNDLLFWK